MQTHSKKPATRSKKARPKVAPDDPVQSRAFVEKAREIEADEANSMADKLIGKLAKMKPEPRPKKAAGKGN